MNGRERFYPQTSPLPNDFRNLPSTGEGRGSVENNHDFSQSLSLVLSRIDAEKLPGNGKNKTFLIVDTMNSHMPLWTTVYNHSEIRLEDPCPATNEILFNSRDTRRFSGVIVLIGPLDTLDPDTGETRALLSWAEDRLITGGPLFVMEVKSLEKLNNFAKAARKNILRTAGERKMFGANILTGLSGRYNLWEARAGKKRIRPTPDQTITFRHHITKEIIRFTVEGELQRISNRLLRQGWTLLDTSLLLEKINNSASASSIHGLLQGVYEAKNVVLKKVGCHCTRHQDTKAYHYNQCERCANEAHRRNGNHTRVNGSVVNRRTGEIVRSKEEWQFKRSYKLAQEAAEKYPQEVTGGDILVTCRYSDSGEYHLFVNETSNGVTKGMTPQDALARSFDGAVLVYPHVNRAGGLSRQEIIQEAQIFSQNCYGTVLVYLEDDKGSLHLFAQGIREYAEEQYSEDYSQPIQLETYDVPVNITEEANKRISEFVPSKERSWAAYLKDKGGVNKACYQCGEKVVVRYAVGDKAALHVGCSCGSYQEWANSFSRDWELLGKMVDTGSYREY